MIFLNKQNLILQLKTITTMTREHKKLNDIKNELDSLNKRLNNILTNDKKSTKTGASQKDEKGKK